MTARKGFGSAFPNIFFFLDWNTQDHNRDALAPPTALEWDPTLIKCPVIKHLQVHLIPLNTFFVSFFLYTHTHTHTHIISVIPQLLKYNFRLWPSLILFPENLNPHFVPHNSTGWFPPWIFLNYRFHISQTFPPSSVHWQIYKYIIHHLRKQGVTSNTPLMCSTLYHVYLTVLILF